MSHSANVALYLTLSQIFTAFAVFTTVTSEAADAQRQIDLSSIPVCSECMLALEPVLTMGDADGPGTIDSESMRVTFDSPSGTYATVAGGQHRIVMFDNTGVFLREIDRKGEGPAELTSVNALQFIDSRLLALDFNGSKLLFIDIEGNLISTARMDLPTGPFRVLAENRIVVGSIDRRPGLRMFPLHEVDTKSGEVVRHFGSVGDDFDLSRPFARLVRLGWALGSRNIWRGYTDILRIEEWTPDGTLIRVISQPPEWFNTLEPGRGSGAPPPSYVQAFGIGHQDRLWLITRVGDDDWRTVVSSGGEGLISQDQMVNYFDTRIDVYDLSAQRHLGYTVLDEASVDLFPHGDWFAIQGVEYDDALVPRIAIYRPRLTNR